MRAVVQRVKKSAAEVDGQKFDGIDIFLSVPHIDIESTADDLGRVVPRSRIDYDELEPGLDPTDHSGVEWIVPVADDGSALRPTAARAVARRMRELVGKAGRAQEPG